MVRKDEDFSKARILVFYLPDNTGQVYIQGTVQKTNSPVIASLGTKRMNYLNRIALDGSKREPRLDALANIFAVFDYKYDVIQYPCGSRQELYREVERMYGRLSAEQMERARIACRKYREKNLEKERARIREWIRKNHRRHLARRRELYHHAPRCKAYNPTKSSMEPEVEFVVKKESVQVSFD